MCYHSAMTPYEFRVDRPQAEPLVRRSTLDGPADAMSYARQLLRDWPECIAVEVLQAGDLLERLRPPRA